MGIAAPFEIDRIEWIYKMIIEKERSQADLTPFQKANMNIVHAAP